MRGLKIFRWSVYFVVLLVLVNYILGARLRAKADNCTLDVSHNRTYVAEQCIIDSWRGVVTVRVRIFRNGGNTVLAERRYEADDKHLVWGANGRHVYYGGDSGSIDLPPHPIDRLRAILP